MAKNCQKTLQNNVQAMRSTMNDGRGRIVDLFGPYSPKTHDSEFLKLQKDLITNAYTGAEILADGHYMWNRHFVLLKLKYKSLANKFTEGERELQKLVFYSVGLYNLEL
jgi:hypothetical protein